jgi:hypothetical protein
MAAAIGAQSSRPDAAKGLLQYLTGSKAAPLIKASGMKPAAK